MQPLVLSPKVWMCMPRLALASWPLRSQVTVVGAPSDSCSKVTVPETLESPRTTATRRCAHISIDSTASSSSSNRQQARHLQGSDAQEPRDPGPQRTQLGLRLMKCSSRLRLRPIESSSTPPSRTPRDPWGPSALGRGKFKMLVDIPALTILTVVFGLVLDWNGYC